MTHQGINPHAAQPTSLVSLAHNTEFLVASAQNEKLLAQHVAQ